MSCCFSTLPDDFFLEANCQSREGCFRVFISFSDVRANKSSDAMIVCLDEKLEDRKRSIPSFGHVNFG